MAREGRSIYQIWKGPGGQAMVEDYQATQSQNVFPVGGYVASFVVTPPPQTETLFIGLYQVRRPGKRPAGWRDPVIGEDVSGLKCYDLIYDTRLDECRERLVIEWSGRTWHQHADRIPKRILADPPAVLATLAGPDADEEEDAGSPEGRILIRVHKARERDPGLRRRKIAAAVQSGQPLICEACDFDFGDFYGKRGSGFIECHHIVPLSEVGQTDTQLADLALICANCHRMAHRQPWLTVRALRDLVTRRKATNRARCNRSR